MESAQRQAQPYSMAMEQTVLNLCLKAVTESSEEIKLNLDAIQDSPYKFGFP
jgi:hypothetical protein